MVVGGFFREVCVMFWKIKYFISKSVWLYPAVYSILSLLGAGLVVLLDARQWVSLSNVLPGFLLTSVGLSKTILGIVATSLLTMTTFTFSTTMVVLTMYSSQFSPRTVENFLSDKNTMETMGTFIGGFIYAIVSLFFMKQRLEGELVVAATLAIIYMALCLIRFIRYILHVGSFIQTHNLIDRLSTEAMKKIEEYRILLERGTILPLNHSTKQAFTIQVKSRDNGYIQYVDYDAMMKIAEKIAGVIVIDKITGQFVTDTSRLFSVHLKEEVELEEVQLTNLLKCVTIGKKQTELQDFNFSIQKIVETALRAISPGINDPNTAIHCLRILGVLLGKLADLEKGYLAMESDKKSAAIYMEIIDFEKEIYFTFYQLVHYGSSDISVMISLLKALRLVMEKASSKNRSVILNFLDYVWEKIDPSLLTGYDLKMLEHEKEEIIRPSRFSPVGNA